MRYIFFTFSFIFLIVRKLLFSANNVHLKKQQQQQQTNKNLVLQQMNNLHKRLLLSFKSTVTFSSRLSFFDVFCFCEKANAL